MVTRLYLVRHAEAEGNVKEFFQGNIDTELTEKGRRQLDCLAERFRDIPIEVMYTSPFQRALMTAEAVNRHHGLPLHKDFALREINGGGWEGRTWAEIPTLYPHQYELWTQKMHLFCAPCGDAMTNVYARMCNALTKIAQENPGKTCAVVSHGCALRAMVNSLYPDPSDFWRGHAPYNCSVTIVEVRGGVPQLVEEDKVFYDPDLIVDHYRR